MGLPKKLKEKYGKSIKLLGAGVFGVVKLYKSNDGRLSAIKKMEYKEYNDISANAVRELAILQRMDDPNILELLDYGISDDLSSLYLVTEFMEHGELTDFIHKTKPKRDSCNLAYKRLVYQLLSGVAYLHSIDILHRDLKPQNILLDGNYNLKIADFGISRALACVKGTGKSVNIVTMYYRAPEILYGGMGNQYSLSLDIWSVGCIIYEILTNEILFKGDSPIDMTFKISRILGAATELNWPGITEYPEYKPIHTNFIANKNIMKDISNKISNKKEVEEWFKLINSLLIYDPSKRATAYQSLKNPLFDDVRDKQQESKLQPRSCLNNLYLVEKKLPGDIFKYQVDINKKMKLTLIDWLVGVSLKFRLNTRTFFIGLYLHDIFVGNKTIFRANYQLYASAALYLAAIYNEIYPLETIELVHVSDYDYTSKDLQQKTTELLNIIDFKMIFSTSYDFLVEYGEFYNDKVVNLAEGLMYYTIFLPEVDYQTKPDQVALLCIMMACMYYSEKFKHISKVTNELIKNIKFCKEIIAKLNVSPLGEGTSINHMFKTKYSPREKISAKIVLEELCKKPLLV